jgi:hypothetical protein
MHSTLSSKPGKAIINPHNRKKKGSMMMKSAKKKKFSMPRKVYGNYY